MRSATVRASSAAFAPSEARSARRVGTKRHVVGAGRASHGGAVRGGHRALHQHRAERGACDTQASGVHQRPVQRRVRHCGGGRDQQRGAGVLQAAQQPGRREHGEHRGQPQAAQPQVSHRVGRRRRGGAQQRDDPGRQRRAGDREQHAERGGQVDAVDAPGQGAAPVPGPQQPRDLGGGAVGEEDAHVDQGRQRGARGA